MLTITFPKGAIRYMCRPARRFLDIGIEEDGEDLDIYDELTLNQQDFKDLRNFPNVHIEDWMEDELKSLVHAKPCSEFGYYLFYKVTPDPVEAQEHLHTDWDAQKLWEALLFLHKHI